MFFKGHLAKLVLLGVQYTQPPSPPDCIVEVQTASTLLYYS